MSHSSREEKQPKIVKNEYELLKREFRRSQMIGGMWGVDDNIIALDIENAGLQLVDLDVINQDGFLESLFEVKDAFICCLSEDKKIFVALSGDGIRVWHLDAEKNLRNIKFADGRFLTIDFPPDVEPARFGSMFFIGGNLNIIARMFFPDRTTKTYIIDVNVGSKTEIAALENVTDYCLLGKDRLVSVGLGKGLRIHEIQLSAKSVTISEGRVIFPATDCDYLRCAASQDGAVLAVQYWDDITRLVTVKRWSFNQQKESFVEIDESPCVNDGAAPIFFTHENLLIYLNRQKKLSVLTPDSHVPVIFGETDDPLACAMPNGNIAVQDRFIRVHSLPQVMYKQALIEFAQAIEVSKATPLPRVLGSIVASYAAEYGLFSIPKEIQFHCSDNQFTRQILENILLGLKNGKRVTEGDKAALTALLKQSGEMRECTDVVLKMLGITEELGGFLTVLKEMFSPVVDSKADHKLG